MSAFARILHSMPLYWVVGADMEVHRNDHIDVNDHGHFDVELFHLAFGTASKPWTLDLQKASLALSMLVPSWFLNPIATLLPIGIGVDTADIMLYLMQ